MPPSLGLAHPDVPSQAVSPGLIQRSVSRRSQPPSCPPLGVQEPEPTPFTSFCPRKSRWSSSVVGKESEGLLALGGSSSAPCGKERRKTSSKTPFLFCVSSFHRWGDLGPRRIEPGQGCTITPCPVYWPVLSPLPPKSPPISLTHAQVTYSPG